MKTSARNQLAGTVVRVTIGVEQRAAFHFLALPGAEDSRYVRRAAG